MNRPYKHTALLVAPERGDVKTTGFDRGVLVVPDEGKHKNRPVKQQGGKNYVKNYKVSIYPFR